MCQGIATLLQWAIAVSDLIAAPSHFDAQMSSKNCSKYPSDYFGNMSSTTEIASSFIQDAPPGELQDVVKDIQSLTADTDPFLLSRLKPAFQKYNEEQLATTELPARTQPVRSLFFPSVAENTLTSRVQKVIISKYNRLRDGRYFDSESNTSFDFDHVTQVSQP